MIGGLIRLIFYAVLVYLAWAVYRFYKAVTRPRRDPPPPPRRIQGVMVKDEVCNTYIPKEEAIREVRDGQERFFCSEECRRKSRAR
jgi:YHS domain-containing protein